MRPSDFRLRRGQLYVHQSDFEMQRLEGDAFVPVLTPPALADAQMMALVPAADGSLLLCTLLHGMTCDCDHPLAGEAAGIPVRGPGRPNFTLDGKSGKKPFTKSHSADTPGPTYAKN